MSRQAHRHVSRRPERLTVDHLAALDAPCRECVFWELDPVRRSRVAACDAAAEKEAWLSTVLRDWGSCGRVVLVDGAPVAYAVYAPASFVPGSGGFPTAPVSPDAVLLTTVWVDRAHTGGGLGRILIQAMARDLIERGGISAVEAFGDTRGPGSEATERPGARCTIPVDFLGRVGFKTQRQHPRHPRMRMELRSALSWRDEVEVALERLLGAVRPEKAAPSPAPRANRATGTD